MSYLQCPECRLTVAAVAYWLRGDQCPRCMTAMAPRAGRFTRTRDAAVPPLPGEAAPEPPASPA